MSLFVITLIWIFNLFSRLQTLFGACQIYAILGGLVVRPLAIMIIITARRPLAIMIITTARRLAITIIITARRLAIMIIITAHRLAIMIIITARRLLAITMTIQAAVVFIAHGGGSITASSLPMYTAVADIREKKSIPVTKQRYFPGPDNLQTFQ